MYSRRLKHGLLLPICADVCIFATVVRNVWLSARSCIWWGWKLSPVRSTRTRSELLPVPACWTVSWAPGPIGGRLSTASRRRKTRPASPATRPAATTPGTATPLRLRVQQHHTFQQKQADPLFPVQYPKVTFIGCLITERSSSSAARDCAWRFPNANLHHLRGDLRLHRR